MLVLYPSKSSKSLKNNRLEIQTDFDLIIMLSTLPLRLCSSYTKRWTLCMMEIVLWSEKIFKNSFFETMFANENQKYFLAIRLASLSFEDLRAYPSWSYYEILSKTWSTLSISRPGLITKLLATSSNTSFCLSQTWIFRCSSVLAAMLLDCFGKSSGSVTNTVHFDSHFYTLILIVLDGDENIVTEDCFLISGKGFKA